MPDEEVPPAIPAATVVLLRDGADGVETLMLRRDTKLVFAGGAWVFPGGRIDPEDYADGVVVDDDAAVLRAARHAASREAMEESGLVVDPDSLAWFAHWTPDVSSPRRFSTWFFMSAAPEGQVVVDDGEIRDHRWIRPTEALAHRDAGEIELITPTWMTLHMLSEATSTEAALAEARSRAPRVYVTHLGRVDDARAAIWQGDVAYDDLDTSKPGPRHRLVMLASGWRLEATSPA